MIKTIVFDLGGVLIDWNPRYLYKKVFVSSEAIEYFLKHICTFDWNEEQDAGRSLSEATCNLQLEYPYYQSEIAQYYQRWEEMLGEEIFPTVDLLYQLKSSGKYKIYALTNWSAETFPIARTRYKFLSMFDDILVSGIEKIKKPEPEIFHLMISRFNLDIGTTLFVDDNQHNIEAAIKEGFKTVHFVDAEQAKRKIIGLLLD